jgi:REP element-mobilizing transposase RayT
VTALLAEIEQQLMAAPPPAAGIAREPTDDSGDTPARRILATASDAELSDSGFSVDNLLSNIEAQLPPNQSKVQPLPSWLRSPPPPRSLPEEAPEAEATVAHQPEPFEETLQHDSVLEIEEEPPFDWEAATFDDTTIMGEAARLEQAEATGDEETSWLAFIGPEGEAEAEETLLAGAPAAEAAVDFIDAEAEPEPEPALEAEAETPELQAEHIDDPYIAQLALSLTDVSLELTADAVLLTRERDIAAFAGRMSRAELLELRQVIEDDWEAAASDARIRFLRLPESGKDVMLYSRRTVEDLTLSLVFDGAMPLRDIRQQGKRLTDALAAVPEVPVDVVLSVSPEEQDAEAADAPAIPRSPHAYVWLLRDPDAVLARPVAQAILNGLHQQMHEHGWRMHEMRASEDHIYLLADSPDEQPPYKAVRELMRRSAQIAHVQNPALDVKSLWADAYLVVSPGRPLEQDEIQQFIQFERTL